MESTTKTRGRPRKETTPETKPIDAMVQQILPPEDLKTDVHHMLRTISFDGQPNVDGALPVDAVDAHVRTWLDAGYQLYSTHYAGETPTGMRILYIFIKPE